jgi:hypothetical protein
MASSTTAATAQSRADQSANAAGKEVRYPLGPLEEVFWNVGNRFEGDGTAALSARIGGVIQPQRIAEALSVLQKRHPRLRARIVVGEDRRAYYEVAPVMAPVPVRYRQFDSEELPWAAEAQAALNTEFDECGPLCHVTVLQSGVCPISEMVLTFHHSLTDGTSGLLLFHELLSHYEALYRGATVESLLSATEPLPFVAADIPPITAPWRDRWAMFSRLVRGFIRKRRASWTALPRDSNEYTPRWVRWVLPADQTSALERICRKQRLPVYGAVFALAVTSLAELLPHEAARLVCRCPVNMRELPYCKRVISYEHLGCFVSGLDRQYVLRKPYAFWDLARTACNDVREFSAKQGPAMALTMLPTADRIARWLRISPKRPPMRDTMSVNYIPCPPVIQQQYGNLTLEAITGLNRCRYMGVSIMVAALLFKGRLNVTLGSVNVSERLHSDFHAAMARNFERLISGQI